MSTTELERVQSFVELARWRAAEHPERLAYTYLLDGDADEVRLTYTQVDRQARAVAAALQERGLAGERALLLFPPGVEFISAFYGCLYAGVIAVPAYPPDPTRLERSLPRIEAIAANCTARVVLSTQMVCELASSLGELSPALGALPWVATDQLSEALAEGWRPHSPAGTDVAFLQYTSGSTGTPKGVMVTHRNLMENEQRIRQAFEHDEHTVTVGWLPVYHDMGLIGNLMQPFFVGGSLVAMSPMAFLQKPVRWLSAISRFRGTTSGGPNFAYELCVRKVTPTMRAELDLSSWTLAFNGAEPIRADTLDRFVETFGPCGFRREAFYPCFGLAEGTLIVTGGKKSAAPVTLRSRPLRDHKFLPASPTDEGVVLVGSGQTLTGQEVIIVEPDRAARVDDGQIGEIWVRGPSVAAGYWARSEESQQTFQATLREGVGAGESGYLRTGDLGFLRSGELFVTGRLKDMLIIRGQNHYPQDLEATVAKCAPRVRPGCIVAFSAELAGEERAVVVAETDDTDPGALEELGGLVRERVVKEHDVQVYRVAFLPKGALPKTSSGKLQRRACRQSFLDQTLPTLAVV